MYGFGLVALLASLTIGMFVVLKPTLSMLPSGTQQTVLSTGISGSRDICLASAKSAYAIDLQIADMQCPPGAGGVPSASCAKASPEGAKAYAKFESARKNCETQ